jgi:hypothetical protein
MLPMLSMIILEGGVMSRCDKYRDLLELWAEWWNGPGRNGYRYPVIPPITKTGEALSCSLCSGVEEKERCNVCGRKMGGA